MSTILTKPDRSPELVRTLGATHHSGSVLDIGFEPDVIVECTGAGSVIADSIQKIGAGGVICLTGVGAGGTASRAAADVAAAVVLKYNVIVGSVNANKRHWYKANDRLGRLDQKWLSRLITRYEFNVEFGMLSDHSDSRPPVGGTDAPVTTAPSGGPSEPSLPEINKKIILQAWNPFAHSLGIF